MTALRKLAWTIKDVPTIWAFSHYTKIPLEQFESGSLKIKSPFKEEEDKYPSLSIYFKRDGDELKIKFKDFATGLQGSHIDYVMALEGITYGQACDMIVSDYNEWVKSGGVTSFEVSGNRESFRVTDHATREWNILDKEYWTSQGLGSKDLKWGLVQPINSYVLSKGVDKIEMKGDYIYGYYNRSGDLVKIYQPKNKECKFLRVRDYIPGIEHDLKGNKVLIICSSWKDALSLKSLVTLVDVRVPNSENTFFTAKDIEGFKESHEFVFVFFDSDEAGIKAAKKYKELYDVEAIYMNVEGVKDITELLERKGRAYSRDYLVILINRRLNFKS